MKNKFKVALVLISALLFALVLSGCSVSMNSDSEESKIEKPVSDVTEGTGIQGTWSGNSEENNEVVLALNSDGTFDYYVGVAEGDGGGTGLIAGTYTDSGTQLVLTADTIQGNFSVGGFTVNGDLEESTEQVEESGDDAKVTYDYVLNGNTLTLTDIENGETGNTLELTRDTAVNE